MTFLNFGAGERALNRGSSLCGDGDGDGDVHVKNNNHNDKQPQCLHTHESACNWPPRCSHMMHLCMYRSRRSRGPHTRPPPHPPVAPRRAPRRRRSGPVIRGN